MIRLSLFLAVIALAAIALYTLLSPQQSSKLLSEAYLAYEEGENATQVSERTINFNKALSLYSQLEEKFSPTFGNGKLYYNIANSYFQLGQYPWAVLYYYRTLKLNPNDERAERSLKLSLQKLDVPYKSNDTVFHNIFFFHHDISLPIRLRTFFLLSLGALFAYSLYIWRKRNWQFYSAMVFSTGAAVMLLSLGYTQYLTPLQGVLIKSAFIYRDAGEQYARVLKDPLLSGTKVEVLEVLQGGKWFKIISEDGTIGYIPQENLQLI